MILETPSEKLLITLTVEQSTPYQITLGQSHMT